MAPTVEDLPNSNLAYERMMQHYALSRIQYPNLRRDWYGPAHHEVTLPRTQTRLFYNNETKLQWHLPQFGDPNKTKPRIWRFGQTSPKYTIPIVWNISQQGNANNQTAHASNSQYINIQHHTESSNRSESELNLHAIQRQSSNFVRDSDHRQLSHGNIAIINRRLNSMIWYINQN